MTAILRSSQKKRMNLSSKLSEAHLLIFFAVNWQEWKCSSIPNNTRIAVIQSNFAPKKCSFHHKIFCDFLVQYNPLPQPGHKPPMVKWVFYLFTVALFFSIYNIYIYTLFHLLLLLLGKQWLWQNILTHRPMFFFSKYFKIFM